ncbi:UNVERIFIED_CONTAM: hypothetical protein DV033_09690 [Limosilactobacillus fermentum]|nr:hypothetical protein [Limosilactobacillus fermentum]MED7635969.1 hypothetical protein [Limosilactobacillus fermentum]PTS36852.1 hypothetical protein DBQ14_08220 [Limosilactobacillus fermentum]PTV35331.1 hypothetical protein DB329_09160 [Limosilactobacillus fermentum]QAR23273.1 hypothetical protein EQG56_01820 [Limosilactobacillus fermentum]
MDCVVTPLKTLMGFSVHLNVQLKFYNLPYIKSLARRNNGLKIIYNKALPLSRAFFSFTGTLLGH